MERAGSASTGHRWQVAAGWVRAARDAQDLVGLYQRVGAPTQAAYFDATGHRRDRVWVPAWFLVRYQPARRMYVESMNGRVMNTTTVPEVPGIALLADASLYLYRLVRRRPVLTIPLHQATPDSPPSHGLFAKLAAQILGPGSRRVHIRR